MVKPSLDTDLACSEGLDGRKAVNNKPLKIVSSSPLLTVTFHETGAAARCVKVLEGNHDLQERIYLLPKELHEKVARLHLLAPGTELTVSAQEQTVYPGVKVEGPFKRIDYRY